MLQLALTLLIYLILVISIGRYLYRVAAGKRTFADPVFDRVDGVIVPHIDMAQARVGIQQGAADAHVAVPPAEVVHRPVDPLPFVPQLILCVEGHLDSADGLY